MNALVLGCLWVLAASVTAMLPMRFQFIPGIALLVAAPVLIWMIGQQQGWLAFVLAAAAFVSMFRKPLRYLASRALGRARGPAHGASGADDGAGAG